DLCSWRTRICKSQGRSAARGRLVEILDPGDLASECERVVSKDPLHIVHQREVLSDRNGCVRAGPVCGSVCAGEGGYGERSRGLSSRKICDSHCSTGTVGRVLIGVESRTVVAREAVFNLIDYMRREDMRFFGNAHRRFGSINLAVVIGNWPDVATSSRLTDREGTGLTANTHDERQGVLGCDVPVDAIRGRPVGQPGLVRRDVIARVELIAERRDILLHVESNLRELARRDHVNASCSCGPKNRIACFARSAGIDESIPVTAWAVSAVRSASGLGERIVDADTI